ncbi:MAG: phosphotransferase enzyme family protein, partial [Calditrichaeota bacterium]
MDRLLELFRSYFGEEADEILPLKAHGSDRRIYRLRNAHRSVIGVSNANQAENVAFIEFSRHFRTAGLPVPEIYTYDLDQGIYLEEDLGPHTLFDLLLQKRSAENPLPAEIEELYHKAAQRLPDFQVKAGKSVNFDLCFPRKDFDARAMKWDLNYFKYYFLKLANIPFDEDRLEEDFGGLIDFLVQAERGFFLYRDFQARNVIIRDGEPYFIDYQGGCRGALQYDIASLLSSARASLPTDAKT